MSINLTPSQWEGIIEDAKREVVSTLLKERRDDLELLTTAQVAGILDVNVKTLETLQIPRCILVPNRVIRYRASDLAAWLKERSEAINTQ